MVSQTSITNGIDQFFNNSVLWWFVVILLLHVTVTLGGEEPVSREKSFRKELNSHSIVPRTTSPSPIPSPPVVLSVSWPIPHPNANIDFEDTSNNFATSIPTFPSGDEGGRIVTPTTVIEAGEIDNSSLAPTRRRPSRREFCSKAKAYLDKCLAHIPPIPDTGIPSTPNAVEAACKTFHMGMACVDGWTSKCLAKDKIAKFKESISGAHETFTFLCRDHTFRQEFLKHGDCYKRISNQWDECSKHFIDNMKRFHTVNSTIQCCVRISFLQCVSEISHYHCKKDAAKFLQRMAETLIRATMRTHLPPQCVSIQQRNCSILSGALTIFPPRQTTFSTIIFTILLPMIWCLL